MLPTTVMVVRNTTMTDESPDAEHTESTVGCFDAHSDVLYSVVRERAEGRTSVLEADFLPGMTTGDIRARVVAIYVDDDYVPEMELRRSLDIVAALNRELAETPDIQLATTPDEIRTAFSSDVTSLVLGMEGAGPLKGDEALLDVFYELGLRLLTLTHSRRNAVGDGCFFSPTKSGTPGGLTPFGVEVVERMNDLGIVVDVSHLNVPGFWDVVDVSSDPIIASHSNCRAVHDHARNLSDDQLEAIAASGGVVGMVSIKPYVAAEDATLDDLLDHVEHAVNLVGVESVAFGFDFFSYGRQYLSAAENERLPGIDSAAGIENDAAVANLTPALEARGFDRTEIEAMLHGNLLRVFEDVLSG